MRRTVALAVSLLVVGSCMGDLNHPVIFENATDAKVTLYPYGRSHQELKRVLEPGATHKDNIPVSDMKRETYVAYVEAVNESGDLVFCHRYTNGDLDQLQGRIVVRAGELQC